MPEKLQETKLFIKTTRDIFGYFLERYTSESLPKKYPLGPGFLHLYKGEPIINKGRYIGFEIKVRMSAKFGDIKEITSFDESTRIILDDDQEYIPFEDLPGILFELIPLAEIDNLEVRTWYYWPELQHYFIELLNEIRLRWPESTTQNKNIVTQIKYDLDPMDERIIRFLEDDPNLTDEQVAAKTNLTRGTINRRRTGLRKAGYKV
ncbi:MAG: winged helix-turn-helix domain-containing protein [Anaerolineaceae bacterium]|nr:winged helix-turn-helix domain-containing protein [Anaerolineaceae bacterium]